MHRKPFKVRALDLPSCRGGGGGGAVAVPNSGGRGGRGGGAGAVPNSGGPVVTFDGLDRCEYPMSYWEPDCMHPAPTKNQPTNKKDRKRRRKKKGSWARTRNSVFPFAFIGWPWCWVPWTQKRVAPSAESPARGVQSCPQYTRCILFGGFLVAHVISSVGCT